MPEPRVVLAEDDADLRTLLATGLRRRGWEVRATADGAAALAAATADAPDVVVLDGRLPLMSGAEVCAALRADPRTAHVPVVMLSGEASTAPGADAHLTKPVRLTALADVLDRLRARG